MTRSPGPPHPPGPSYPPGPAPVGLRAPGHPLRRSALPAPPPGLRAEPGSFRDPGNRVFHRGREVLRGLGPEAAATWRAVGASPFFQDLLASGRVCGTEPVDPAVLAQPDGTSNWPVVLRHERIPFVTYPYEWSFSMLRDAALLHLQVLRAALEAGFTMTDGSAYNVQWRGVQPVFVDVGSFTPARPGEPWAGYRQFCQTLLYPLLLQAHLGVEFQPWLRARIDGIEAAQLRPLFGGLRALRAGVLRHLHLHGALQARYADSSGSATREQLRQAGFSHDLVLALVRSLDRLVRRLAPRPADSHWAGYRASCGYTDADRAGKERFVTAVLAGADDPELVLDLGANDGVYARIAARHAGYVVAAERDPVVADQLYRELRADLGGRILPLVLDLADPSPGGGWRGTERAPFAARAEADVVLALALVHHLAIDRNVPLPEVIDWLAGFLARTGRRGRLVVEFPHPDDPMVRRLLANKPAGLFPGYRRAEFERLLGRRFEITGRLELPSGTRTLYAGIPRA